MATLGSSQFPAKVSFLFVSVGTGVSSPSRRFQLNCSQVRYDAVSSLSGRREQIIFSFYLMPMIISMTVVVVAAMVSGSVAVVAGRPFVEMPFGGPVEMSPRLVGIIGGNVDRAAAHRRLAFPAEDDVDSGLQFNGYADLGVGPRVGLGLRRLQKHGHGQYC
jgi:hypothetical protein